MHFWQQLTNWPENFINNDNIAAYYNRFGSRGIFPSARQMPLANMGYWKDVAPNQPEALDLATNAFFDLICRTAEVSTQDDFVLDAGCGYGTNAIYCMQHFQPRRVVGLNLSQVQINTGQKLVAEAGLSDKITITKSSATDMPFVDASVNKILCIEAASHFKTRENFFRQAYRVLRPGGLLVLADYIIPPAQGLLQKVLLHSFRYIFQFPKENVYDTISYLAKLQTAGFEIVDTYSIYRHIIPPFKTWVRTRTSAPFPGYNLLVALGLKIFFWYPLDYVCIKARKTM